MKKLKLKSNKGFTMEDLVAAIIIILLFVGVLGSLMYSALKINLETKLAGTATYYTMQILEDIDKISYDEVTNGMEEEYIEKFSISSGFDLSITVSSYSNGTDTEDLVKTVKVTITYGLLGNSEQFVVEKLKVKEV